MPSQTLSNDSHSNSTATKMSLSTFLTQPLQMDLHPGLTSILTVDITAANEFIPTPYIKLTTD
jgi:hypothetical protein